MTTKKKPLLSLDDGPEVTRNVCLVGTLLSTLDPESRDVLNQWLANSDYSSTAIHAKLKKVGVEPLPSLKTLQNHRRGNGTCACRS